MMKWLMVLVMVMMAGVLTACATPGDPASAIERYIEVRATGDAVTLVTLACPSWEGQAIVEATSFQGRNATVSGMSCVTDGAEGAYTRVACAGQITTEYGGEDTVTALDAQVFLASDETGEWLMCGYSAGE